MLRKYQTIDIDALHTSDPVHQLVEIAKIKFCLEYTAFLVWRKSKTQNLDELQLNFLEQMNSLLNQIDNDSPRMYICKHLLQNYGRRYLLEEIQSGTYTSMFPQSFRNSQLVFMPDFFNVCGSMYRQFRNFYLKYLFQKNFREKLKVDNTFQIIFLNLSLCYILLSDNFSDSMKKKAISTTKSIMPSNSSYISLFRMQKKWTDDKYESQSLASNKNIYCLLYHLFTVLEYRKENTRGILLFFIELMYHPESLNDVYFPAMPQNVIADAIEGIYDEDAHWESDVHVKKFYECPNGHIYGVGNCGGLEGSGECPDCPPGTAIGANQRNPREIDISQYVSEPNYVLHEVDADASSLEGIRQLRNIDVAIVRFLIHASMKLCQNKEGLRTVFNSFQPGDIDEHLMSHLQLNFCDLSCILNKSEDETQFYLHRVIDKFMTYQNDEIFPLYSMNERRSWEKAFSSLISSSMNLLSEEYQEFLEASEKDMENISPFCQFNHLSMDSNRTTFPFTVNFWQPTYSISFNNLFKKYSPLKLKETCPLLTYLYEHQEELQHTQQLPDIIKLQETLIAHFNFKLDARDLEMTSVSILLRDHFEYLLPFHDSIREKVKKYVRFMNLVKDKIFSHNQTGKKAALCVYKKYGKIPCFDMNSPCGILLPNKSGFGLCALSVVEYLIDLHNSAVIQFAGKEKIASKFQTTTPSNLDFNQMVTFNREELEPMVMLHSNCRTKCGEEFQWQVDLHSLEEHLENRFFAGRVCFIAEDAPKILLSHENTQNFNLKGKIPQNPLRQFQQEILENQLTNPPDVCQLLYHCQTILYLLIAYYNSGTIISETTSLAKFISNVGYKLPASLSDKDPLYGINVEHMDDLIIFLNVLRAKEMILLNQDPWTALIKSEMRAELDLENSEITDSLDDLLCYFSKNKLLSIFFLFIRDLVATDYVLASSPLNECLSEYLDSLEDEYIPETDGGHEEYNNGDLYESDNEDNYETESELDDFDENNSQVQVTHFENPEHQEEMGQFFYDYMNEEIRVSHIADCFSYLVRSKSEN